MTAHVVAFPVNKLVLRNPMGKARREFFRILFELESGGNQAIGDGPMRRIVRKILLDVTAQSSLIVGSEIRTRHHRQVVRIGRMNSA